LWDSPAAPTPPQRRANQRLGTGQRCQSLRQRRFGALRRWECPPGAVGERDEAGLDWDNATFTLCGCNRVRQKPDTHLIARYRDDPFLVTGRYGQGRTATFASDFAPHWLATVTGISVNGTSEPVLPAIEAGGATPEAAFDALETALLRLTESSITAP
jgi:hypothetical protein